MSVWQTFRIVLSFILVIGVAVFVELAFGDGVGDGDKGAEEIGVVYETGKPDGFVNDYAGILSDESEAGLEQMLMQYEAAESNEIAVVTVPNLGDDYLENYAEELFARWGIGKAQHDNGLLLLIAVEEKKIRIEVGYGLEGALTDGEAGRIINGILKPAFRSEKYDEGVWMSVQAMMEATAGEYEGTGVVGSGEVSDPLGTAMEIFFSIIFLLVMFLFPLIGAAALTEEIWPGAAMGGLSGWVVWSMFGYMAWFPGWFWLILFGGAVGLGVDYFVSRATLLTGWRESLKKAKKSGKGGGFWFRGGRGGGGSGGGFGGFGGGMSGGGGASGGW